MANDTYAALQKAQNAFKNGDKSMISYVLKSTHKLPVMCFNGSAILCSTFLVLGKTTEGEYTQGFINSEWLTDDRIKIANIFITRKEQYSCQVLIEMQDKAPIIVGNNDSHEAFLIYARTCDFSQFVLYDKSIGVDQPFSLIGNNEHASIYFARLAERFIQPCIKDEQAVSVITKF